MYEATPVSAMRVGDWAKAKLSETSKKQKLRERTRKRTKLNGARQGEVANKRSEGQLRGEGGVQRGQCVVQPRPCRRLPN